MKIYLLDINKEMTDAWYKYFYNEPDVEIVNDDFTKFMDAHPNTHAIVSPANSFGLMDGGYDKAISQYFGPWLAEKVREKILWQWYGEQPTGTSMSVLITDRLITMNTEHGNFMKTHPVLIHTPTMRTPERIDDYRIIYQCMRSTLIEALTRGVKTIVIPAFGGLTGGVLCDVVARMMYLGYKQVNNPPKEINWGYALYVAKELNKGIKRG